jgi:hypothetical protein
MLYSLNGIQTRRKASYQTSCINIISVPRMFIFVVALHENRGDGLAERLLERGNSKSGLRAMGVFPLN